MNNHDDLHLIAATVLFLISALAVWGLFNPFDLLKSPHDNAPRVGAVLIGLEAGLLTFCILRWLFSLGK